MIPYAPSGRTTAIDAPITTNDTRPQRIFVLDKLPAVQS